MKNLLIGRWIFKASQRLFKRSWIESGEHVNGMTWDFNVEYISQHKHVGTIVEQAPNREPVHLNYMYNSQEMLLTIEIGVNEDGSFEVDKYNVIPQEDGDVLLSMKSFRYLLSNADNQSMTSNKIPTPLSF